MIKWWNQLWCNHWFDELFWYGNSDMRPVKIQVCRYCNKGNVLSQDDMIPGDRDD